MIVRLVASKASVPANGDIEIGVEVVGANNTGEVELVVVYPDGVLAFENAAVGPFLSEGGAYAYLGSDSRFTGHGQIGLVFERHEARDGASGSGRLAGVRFRAVGSGKARISLEQGVARVLGSREEIPCDWEGTQVVVEEERRRRGGNLEPTARDLQILCWVHEMKHLTYEQFMGFFPCGSGQGVAWYGEKRLEKMVALKVVRRAMVFGQERKAVMLEQRGLDLLKSRGLDRRLALYRPDSNTPSRGGATFSHDAMMVDLRRLLEIDLGLVAEWLSERVVRHAERAQGGPDAIVAWKAEGSDLAVRVAIELELSRKVKARYAKLLEWYAGRQDLDAVLYVALSEEIASVVQRTRAWGLSISRGPAVHVVLLQDLLAFGLEARTRSAGGPPEGRPLRHLGQGGLALAS